MAIPEVPNDIHWIVGFDTPKLPQNPHEALRARFETFLRTKLNIAPTQDDYIAVIKSNTAISNGSFNEAAGKNGRFILGCWGETEAWTVYDLDKEKLKSGLDNKGSSADTMRKNINPDAMGTQIYPPVPAANGGAQQP